MKQKLTPAKAQATQLSLQKLAIMSQIIKFEQQELDVDFRIPILNNFASRIKADSEAILRHLEKSGRWGIVHTEVAEDYAGEIWRVFDLLCGLDIELVKHFADELDREFKNIGI